MAQFKAHTKLSNVSTQTRPSLIRGLPCPACLPQTKFMNELDWTFYWPHYEYVKAALNMRNMVVLLAPLFYHDQSHPLSGGLKGNNPIF